MNFKLLALVVIASLAYAGTALADDNPTNSSSKSRQVKTSTESLTKEQFEKRQAAALKNAQGVKLFVAGKSKEAIAKLDEAIKIDPGYSTAYINRGNTKSSLKQYAEAVADFSKAIEIGHKSTLASAYSNRGVVYYKMHKIDEAIADLSKGIELRPKAIQALNTRAVCYLEQGKKDLALADANTVLSLEPNNKYATSMVEICKGEAESIGLEESHRVRTVKEKVDPSAK